MRFSEFDLKTNFKIGEYNSRKISLSTGDLKPIRFQIPRMYIPFGVSGFTPEVGTTKYNVDFSMKGWDEEDNYVNKFYNHVKEIETMIITKVVQNSEIIFGSQLTIEEITNMFNSNIKEQEDREPKFRLKIDDGTRVFDVADQDVTTELENGLYAKHSGIAMVELGSVYFLNRMFGVTWKMTQLKLYEPQRLKGFQFQLTSS
jgi:hypothetical protein